MVGSAARMAEGKTVHTVLATFIRENRTMPRLVDLTPKYRCHKASGQAIVTVQEHDFYLGPWNTKASKLEYDRIIGEWLASGRQLPL
jgi:hypothetical protein